MNTTYQLAISNLSCAGCVGRAERAVQPLPGVDRFEVNLATRQAELELAEPAAYPSVLQALARAGYPAVDPPADPNEALREEHRSLGRQWRWAAVLCLPLLVIEMGGHLFPTWMSLSADLRDVWNLCQFGLATGVLFGPARALLKGGWHSLQIRAPDMNALVLLGAGSAYVFSSWVWLTDQPYGLYFEAAAVICTLILLGRWLEQGARGRTGQAIQSLMALKPAQARRWQGDQWAVVDAAAVQAGDRIQVLPGQAVPADGRLCTPGWLDESLLTGESEPSQRQIGDPVVGGSLNSGQQALEFETTATGQATALAGIIAMVAQAQATRLPVQALINKVTLWFVPAVLLLAALSFAVWFALDGFERAMVTAVSVLIIACPCAMGLATPMSIVVGMGRAARLGVLFRRGAALEQLGQVRTIAFDKTGTLTQGNPECVHAQAFEGFELQQIQAIAAGLELHSTHPLARALAYSDPANMQDSAQLAGQGVEGVDEQGQRWHLGKLDGLAQIAGPIPQAIPQDSPDTLVGLVCEDRWAGWFQIADPIKPGAREAIHSLKQQGYQVAMLSGDRDAVADHVAQQLGIDQVHAGLSPADKLDRLKQLDQPVAFVGDGINDAPALAQAQVGIAIGTGTQVAIDTADLVLMGGDPLRVAQATDLSRATLRNIRQNLVWAFGYNIALIPVAMGLWGISLSPMLAAGAMALSSVFVVSNALRLRWR